MILCCGEALIDMLPRRTAEGEDVFAPHAGGSVFNTAVALGRLGGSVGFFSGLSTDMFGELLARTLAASKVDCALAARSACPTTLAFVDLVDGQARYAFYDENTASRLLGPQDLPTLPDDIRALFFGGISLVVEPCGSAYEALMQRAARHHVTMIDPNIRPDFITDATAYRARLARLIGMADIVKLSDDDLHWLMGPGDMMELARRILVQGPNIVLITEGASGAHGITARHSTYVPANRVDVADTVGAGDTFNAGILASFSSAGLLSKKAIASMSRDAMSDAVSLGVKAAAITVSRPGANPPWRNEID